jgi:hypothetical protein
VSVIALLEDWQGKHGGETDSMEHRMEEFLRAMKAHVNRTQRNRSRARKDQEAQPVTLGLRGPSTSLLQILEGINAEKELRNGQEEHDAEEDSDALSIPMCLNVFIHLRNMR